MEVPIIGYLAVFFARVTDVTIGTVRVLMLMRGKKLWAAAFGFVEVVVYITALKFVFDSLTNPLSIIIYALGFATGNLVGAWVEEKMALGYMTMQVITFRDARAFSEVLREHGFGVSLIPCQGRSGCHELLHIIFERKRMKELENMVHQWDAGAFVTVINSHPLRGGYFSPSRSRK